jgi:hypothetical protein
VRGHAIAHYAPDEVLPAANITIKENVTPGEPPSKSRYRLIRGCCGKEETLGYAIIRTKVINGVTQCRACSVKAANYVNPGEKVAPMSLSKIEEATKLSAERLDAQRRASRAHRSRIEDFHEKLRLDRELSGEVWDNR